ncbi:family S15 peptidase [Mesorhizobium sp. WSM3866]|uniref:CocE/NonD family hydrolase n=1 Tax=Mesorhizobium sp. WSM3866 TaxID=422271 RepID=UPI000BAF5943|nr:CocE/NonD family hydrolase [Mesorhizobium sp. WSM3866]PBB41216.1 family S15 peptidase [Mesorhizobium sp. WSM3866]
MPALCDIDVQGDFSGLSHGLYEIGPVESIYVPMRDGVKLALDIVRPKGDGPLDKRDTILLMTRYWRGVKGSPDSYTGDSYPGDAYVGLAERFVPHGFAVVVGDVRGTGASFGVWRHHYSRAETLDFGEVLDWIAAQPWSTGGVVGTGHSYSGATAMWLLERNHPALRGVIASGVELCPYEENYHPGGIANIAQGEVWGNQVKLLDSNVLSRSDQGAGTLTIVPSPGVRPVGPQGDADLQEALRNHEAAPSEWEGQRLVKYKDYRPPTWAGESWVDSSTMHVMDRISRSDAAIQNWIGWFDGGLAQGAVRRFMGLSNPQSQIIGPWGHSLARKPYDPLLAADKTILPTMPTLEAEQVRFAKACVVGQLPHPPGKILHYYTLGEGWKRTGSWPLPGSTNRRWYITSGSRLSLLQPKTGLDSLKVDPALEGHTSQWWNRPDIDFGDRRKFVDGRLTYMSEALTGDLEVTGEPIIHLNITSTREDAAIFVYLDGIKPDGEPYYLTRGQLRALHRKVWVDSPFSLLGPQHSFLSRDAEPLTPGEPAILTFTMLPISARLPAGHRLRVIIAGSDVPTFASVPADGDPPHLHFHHGRIGCYIDLPIIEA